MSDPIWFDDNAYSEGQSAQVRGVGREACPYDETRPLKLIWWGIGWDDSETESLKHEVAE